MSGGLGSAWIHSHRNVPLDVFGGSSYLFIKIIIIMMTDLIFVKKKIEANKIRQLDHNDGQFFRAMEWLMFFFRPPLLSMVFQWFWQSWTITIECFLGGPTIGTNGFSMVFKILRAMVNNGFGLVCNCNVRQ